MTKWTITKEQVETLEHAAKQLDNFVAFVDLFDDITKSAATNDEVAELFDGQRFNGNIELIVRCARALVVKAEILKLLKNTKPYRYE